MNSNLDLALAWALAINAPFIARNLWVMAEVLKAEGIARQLEAEAKLIQAQIELEKLKREGEAGEPVH